MRYFKISVAITIALSAVLLSLHGLGQAAEVDMPAPDRFRRPIVNPASGLTSTNPVTVQLWLMPDFEEGRVWVNGQAASADRPPIPLKNDGMQSPIWTTAGNKHFFGWWEGSQVISIGRRLEGAYELRLPGLDLKLEDVLNVRLVSGIILTDTLSSQSAGPISRTPHGTGTLGIALDLALPTASSALTATVLTGTYTLTGLEATPLSGEFAVSPTVTLTANYTLPASVHLSATGSPTPTVPTTTLPFSYTVSTFGEFSQLKLTNFSQPVTLTVPFYPFEKAIDLTLTPLLLETVMTHTASATGGNVFHKLAGATYGDGRTIQYAQAGLMGRGDVCVRIRTVEGDRKRSAMALVTAFRKYREEMDRAGADQWRGGLGRLLERHLDFPSFPRKNSLGELQRHKHTIVHVLTRDLSYTVQDDVPTLTLEAPFQLQVWRVRDWAVMGWERVRREQSDERVRVPIYHSPQRPVLEEYAFTDFNLLPAPLRVGVIHRQERHVAVGVVEQPVESRPLVQVAQLAQLPLEAVAVVQVHRHQRAVSEPAAVRQPVARKQHEVGSLLEDRGAAAQMRGVPELHVHVQLMRFLDEPGQRVGAAPERVHLVHAHAADAADQQLAVHARLVLAPVAVHRVVADPEGVRADFLHAHVGPTGQHLVGEVMEDPLARPAVRAEAVLVRADLRNPHARQHG